MAPIDRCLASMARLSLVQSARVARPSAESIPRFLAPAMVHSRSAVTIRPKKAKKALSKDFKRQSLEKHQFPRYTLCEAMRVLRASEVGQPPGVKYELHINLRTVRSGPVIKNSVRLPHPVQSDWQFAVICPEGSSIATAATAAGAVAVGEESIFQAIREEKFTFDRLLCHESSEKALNKAGLGKILGPRGLMPSKRMKTITNDVAKTIKDSAGSTDYRERLGVIRLAIGQIGHTPDQLKANIQTVLARVKSECAELSEEVSKEVHDVILSTTNGPGLSLNGKVAEGEESVSVAALSGPI
ncbi:hypothetical protein HIM_06119 [Hirsutella minnesotensis 3608]|uniref:50S ribosomal protein L1 n=1 Tax=Hirsutella minnesotensis 3608 TaxID=1043627 RepID=A0A0F7ZUA5_9HYPO|nr:hypothetical protein HIM_06119 [Hirsutella minnesotensis 3608]